MRWFHTCIHFFHDDDDDDDDKDPSERERQQERAFKRKSLYIRGYNNNNNQFSIFESPIIHSVCPPNFARYCLQMLLGGLHIPYAHLIIFTCILRNINIKLLLLPRACENNNLRKIWGRGGEQTECIMMGNSKKENIYSRVFPLRLSTATLKKLKKTQFFLMKKKKQELCTCIIFFDTV